MKLGSLFDGSGGFPLAGTLTGVTPVWSSEIEAYPLRVTAARFPNVKQLGDVTRINGAEIEPVDIITFGSPCQDLSIAGKQLGIHDGARSNLFFEAVRIIQEMRQATDGRYPRFAVWENVPGAFSSNRGADFQAVLQALCEVKGDPPATRAVPMPAKGKWRQAGCVVGNGYSLAWRVYDAQFWGVPQRRKRIYLIADFGSERAGEILFERESGAGYFEPCSKTWKGTAADAERSTGRGDTELHTRKVIAIEGNGSRPSHHGSGYDDSNTMYTLNATDRHAVVYDARGNGNGAVCPTLTGDHQNRVTDYTSLVLHRQQAFGQYEADGTASALKCRDYKDATDLIVSEGKPPRKYVVRRLTPLECCRLQGFPDWWTDGVDGSDSAQFKMWGNAIAIPCATDVLWRITKDVTLNGR